MHFIMDKAKAVSIPVASHFMLSQKLCLYTNEEKLSMKNIYTRWMLVVLCMLWFAQDPIFLMPWEW